MKYLEELYNYRRVLDDRQLSSLRATPLCIKRVEKRAEKRLEYRRRVATMRGKMRSVQNLMPFSYCTFRSRLARDWNSTKKIKCIQRLIKLVQIGLLGVRTAKRLPRKSKQTIPIASRFAS